MLEVKHVTKTYITQSFKQTALDNVSITFRSNEFVAVLGQSGSGKTTLLNIIGGLDHYDTGDLIIDGISTKKYKDKDWDTYRNNRIGFVFQSYNLIPHQNVLENVELALTLSGVSKEERRKKALYQLERVGLKDHVNKKPSQLSGGQMQRVAIARALINDPEILLADEPTGALDSKTSVQIMDLLLEIAKDRLVLMVTHNPELAHEYANRIVTLKDGKITDDTNPINDSDKSLITNKPSKKTKMSYFTALSLSFKNLLTKKGRTIMTSFAGSIGIIGIAAILALSNGANLYIQSVEEDTLSEYPLTIEKNGMDLTSLISGSNSTNSTSSSSKSSDSNTVSQANQLQNMLSKVKENDLGSLKTYLDNNKNMKKYARSVDYQYDVTPQIYLNKTDAVKQVNPNQTFSDISFDNSELNQSFSMMSSTKIFQQLPSDLAVAKGQYSLIKGKYPTKKNELLLVLGRNGKISDSILYTMGLRDTKELTDIVSSKTTTIKNSKITYKQLMNTSFKNVYQENLYSYDSNYNIYVDKTDDNAYMQNQINNGQTLNIVGIVEPSDDDSVMSMSSGIYYTSDLTKDIVNKANSSEIVKKQKENKNINIFSGKSFDDENSSNSSFDINSLFTFNGDALKNSITIDQSKLAVDMSKMIDTSSLTSNIPAPNIDTSSLTNNITSILPVDKLSGVMNKYLTQYSTYLQNYYAQTPTPTTPPLSANEWLAQSSIQTAINNDISAIMTTDVNTKLQNTINSYVQTTISSYTTTVMKNLESQIQSSLSNYMSSFQKQLASAINVDQNQLKNMIQMNKTPEELSQLLVSMMSPTKTSYQSNLKTLGAANFDEPDSVYIYPKDFDSKEKIINVLDKYNSKMQKTDKDKVITYTDLVGTLMTSVTDIINMISTILIAFVAISLVVSSIMIGVITYISVLERKKEIGILRSIGASKKDISHVFNAETIIIGFFAGLIGVILTYLVSIPANIIVEKQFGVANLVNLPITAALLLIVISVVLTFIGGFIPARQASRKDPVEALRSE